MAAVFEMYLVSTEYIDFCEFDKVWDMLGKSTFRYIEVFNDFTFDHERKLDLRDNSRQSIISILKEEKIIQYGGNIGNNKIGIQQYMEEDGRYISNLWFNTEGFQVFDSDIPNDSIKRLYFSLEELSKPLNIVFFAIGCEMVVNYAHDCSRIKDQSHNICLWWTNDCE